MSAQSSTPPPQAGLASGAIDMPPPIPICNGDRLIYTVFSTKFEVPKYYRILQPIGYGAYGFVVSALDTRTNKRVAIKKNSRVFRDVMDCKRIVREVLVLESLRHENIVHIRDFYVPLEDGPNGWRDVYMVTDLMDTTLHAVIRSTTQQMGDQHYKFFAYQILRGLKFLHSAGVIHRDLKPANLLVNIDCDLQICDFGLARQYDEASNAQMTDYVVTRYYRPPELLLLSKKYSPVVDTWSVGCIIVELMERRTLFKGMNFIQQLDMILHALRPTASELSFLEPDTVVTVEDRIDKLKASWGADPQIIAPHVTDPIARDFIMKMLVFDPRQRATPDAMLKHPYLADLHDAESERSATSVFFWDKERIQVTEELLRAELLEVARRFGRSSSK